MKLLILLSLFLPSFSFASGKVLFVKGNVTINKSKPKKGSTVKEGDIISTTKNGLILVKFASGSTLKVNKESEVKVQLYKPESKSTLFSLIKGSGFFRQDPKVKGKLNVKTRFGAMGVRGTQFFVSYGAQKKDVFMCVNKGSVWVKDKTKKVTAVNEGEGVVVGQSTSKPQFLPWTKNLNWRLDPSEGELENSAKIEESYKNPLRQDYD
ncbi:MAG: FecR family protein [Bdellovibrionota bacterium]|nr:FecR family protein [Bdellovibrionota bacterium]